MAGQFGQALVLQCVSVDLVAIGFLTLGNGKAKVPLVEILDLVTVAVVSP